MIDDDRDGLQTRRQFLRGLGTVGAAALGLKLFRVFDGAEQLATMPDAAASGAAEGARAGSSGRSPVAAPRPATSAAAAAGAIEVISRRAWGAQPRGDYTPQQRVERLTVHHSGVFLRNNRDAPRQLKKHLKLHFRQGRPDIAYHFLIDQRGNVYEGRPVNTQTDSLWGTYDVRGHLLVMCEGNFEVQRPPAAQLASLADVLAWGAQEYDIDPDSIRGHRVFAATACPGKNLNAMIRKGKIARMVEKRIESETLRLEQLPVDVSRERLRAITAGA